MVVEVETKSKSEVGAEVVVEVEVGAEAEVEAGEEVAVEAEIMEVGAEVEV